MDNNLSSMLYALSTFRQGTQIDEASLLAGKIQAYSNSAGDANTALSNALALLVSAYPNSNQYDLLNVTFTASDPSTIWAVITVRVK